MPLCPIELGQTVHCRLGYPAAAVGTQEHRFARIHSALETHQQTLSELTNITNQHHDAVLIGPGGQRSQVPTRVIEEAENLRGVQNTSSCVHSGTFTIDSGAIHNGSIQLLPSAELVVRGTNNGSLHVARNSRAVIVGRQNGSVHVDDGGLVRVETTGRLAGSLHVNGRIEHAGTRGGSVAADAFGEIVDLPGSTVKQPTTGTNGASIYNW